jgi:phosphoribosylanthranilate isomerase
MSLRVKICGITDRAGLEAALDAGADAVGFVLAPSPRQLGVAEAAALCAATPPFVSRVLVFREPPAELVRVALETLRPDHVQLEAEDLDRMPAEARDRVLPVFHDDGRLVERLDDWLAGARERTSALGPEPPAIHLEGPGRGGRGVPVDRRRAAGAARRTRIVLAGGLRPETVGDAVREVRPYAVDVSSGVESAPGKKDPARVRAFVSAARAAAGELGGAPSQQEER